MVKEFNNVAAYDLLQEIHLKARDLKTKTILSF